MNLFKSTITQIVVCSTIIVTTYDVNAQKKEDNIWHFGHGSAIDFSSGSPVSIMGSSMWAWEGCNSICDSTGNLQFYAAESTVWDRTGAVMPNGTGLKGDQSTTMGVFMVPQPCNPKIYYLFHNNTNNGNIYYSVVDMSLNGGKGDVTAVKNVFFRANQSEKMIGILHANQKDIWLVLHDRNNSNSFVSYLITSAGIDTANPVISNTGPMVSNTWSVYSGEMKASPDGSMIAFANPKLNLFDFDRTTGTVSNYREIGTLSAYGVEWSADQTRLYADITNGSKTNNDVYQYDLTAGTPAAISASQLLLGSGGGYDVGSMTLAPNGKIYIAQHNSPYLSVINNPNSLGTACNFVPNAFMVGSSTFGLPFFVRPSYPKCGINILSINATKTNSSCNGLCNGTATANPVSGSTPYTYSWNTTPVQTTKTAIGLCAGNYTVTVTDAASTTATATVTITQPSLLTASAAATAASCGNNNGTAAANPLGGTAGYTYSWNTTPAAQLTQTATGLGSGNYSVTVTDANGCSTQQAVTITANNTLSVSVTSTQTGCTVNNGTATANPNNGTAPYTFTWNNSQSTQTATGFGAGSYTVTVTDANGCSTQQTVSITANNTLSISVTSAQTGCTVNNGTATANPNGTAPYTYSWNNGQTIQTATGLGAGNYNVTVTDANGCTQTTTVNVSSTLGPAVTVSADITITPGDSTQLSATGGGTYSWLPATGLSCTTCSNPTATAAPLLGAGGLYCVTVTDANWCSNSACVKVTVEMPCGDVFVPSAFSPNNDGINEIECVLGNCIATLHFSIYDRWGNKVFETTDPQTCWDGMYKGKAINSSAFVYYMEATLTSGEKISKKGNISLIR